MAVLLLAACMPTLSQALVRPTATGWTEVCTATGMVWVRSAPGDPLHAPEAPVAPASMDPLSCDWCQWHAGPLGDLPPAPLFWLAPPRRADGPVARYRSAPAAAVWQPAQSRAPPPVAA